MPKPNPWQLNSAQIDSQWDWLFSGNAFIIPLWEGSGSAVAYNNPTGDASDEITGQAQDGDPTQSWVSHADGPAINPTSGPNAEDSFIFSAPSWLQSLPQGNHTIIVVADVKASASDKNTILSAGDTSANQWWKFGVEENGNTFRFHWDPGSNKKDPLASSDISGAVHTLAARRDDSNTGAELQILMDGGHEGSESLNSNFTVEEGIIPGAANWEDSAVDSEILAVYIIDHPASNAELSNLASNPYGPITQASAGNDLLDKHPNSEAGYSVDQIRGAYSGSLVSSTSGPVDTWHDQSGHDRDLSESGSERAEYNSNGLVFDGAEEGYERSIPSSAAYTIGLRAHPTDRKGSPQTLVDVDGIRVYEYDGLIYAEVQNGSSSSWSTLGSFPGNGLNGLVAHNGVLYAAGRDSGGVYKWDGSSWSTLGTWPGGRVFGICIFQGELHASDPDNGNVYKWDGSSWNVVGTYPQNGGPRDMVVYDGDLYGVNPGSDNITRWDGSSWSTVSGYPGTDPFAVSTYRGQLVTADFGSDSISAYDGSWSTLGTLPGSGPFGLAVFEGSLWVANRGSDSVDKWDGSSWSTPGTYPGGNPHGLLAYDGRLFVPSSGDNTVYAWDTSSWSSVGSYSEADPDSLAVWDGKLAIGNFGGNSVSVWGDGASVFQSHSGGEIRVVVAVDGSNIVVRTGGSESSTSHSVSRSQNGTLDVAFAEGTTQGGWFGGGGDEIYDGQVHTVAFWPSFKSQSDRSDIETTLAGDTTPPTQANATASKVGTDGYSGSVDVSEGGTNYHVVTESSTKPDEGEVKAGQNHNGSSAPASNSNSVGSSGTVSVGQTGVLSDSTQYWVHYMHEDAAGNQSSVVTAGPFTTDAITGSISVTATDAQGNAISGATVAAVNSDLSGAAASGTTDANGEVTLSGLTAGDNYHVYSLEDISGDPAEETTKLVIETADSNGEIPLTGADAVYDEQSSSAVQGATVVAVHSSLSTVSTATTDSNGNATISGLTQGDTFHVYSLEDIDSDNVEETSQVNIETVTADAPQVDSLTAEEVETQDDDFEVDVKWSVSDPDANLDRVEFTLRNTTEGADANSAQIDVSGGSADHGQNPTRLVAHGKEGSGDTFEVWLDVYDEANNSERGTVQITETEPVSPPSIDGLTITEVETSNSDAEFDIGWSLSDPDSNLSSLDLTLTDTTDNHQEDTASPSVSGGSASGTTRMVATGDDTSGHAYTVEATVTDADSQTDSETATTSEGEVTATPYLSASISYGDAQNQWSNIGSDGSAMVIQAAPRHYSMYDTLKGYSVSDVSVNSLGSPSYSPGSGASNDEVYKTWLPFRGPGGEWPEPDLLRYPDEDFVLNDGNGNGFEAGSEVRISLSSNQVKRAVTHTAAWWTDFNVPGLSNPYHNSDNAKRKVMAQVMVDLMELERFIRDEGPTYGNSNLIGMVIRDNALATAHAGDVLPDRVKYAVVEQIFWCLDEALNTRFYPWTNENMSSKGLCALCVCWRLLDDLEMETSQKDTVMSTVRDALYTDSAQGSSTPNDDSYGRRHDSTTDATNEVKGLTRPDGGWIENGGANSQYNGMQMQYCLEGYGYVKHWPEWDHFKEMIKRIYVRGTYEAIEDYGGMVSAPSLYTNREMGPITEDEHPSAGKYALAAQWFGEDVYPWFGSIRKGDNSNCIPPSISDMEDRIQTKISELAFSEDSSHMQTWKLATRWGPYVGPGFIHYENGTYSEIKQAVDNNHTHLKVPQARDGNTYTRIKEDMLFRKGIHNNTEWGCFVEMALWPGQYSSGMQNLNAFWTGEAGPVILNISPKATWNPPSFPRVRFDVDLSDGSEHLHFYPANYGVTTPVDHRTTDHSTFIEQEMTKGQIINRTRADLLSGGLQMTNELRPSGSSFEWTNATYKLPIFRGRGDYVFVDGEGDTAFDEFAGPRTRIEFWNGTSWQLLGTTSRTTQYIRLSRDLGSGRSYAYMALDQQRTVYMLQSEDYHQRHPWQSNSFRHRDMRIDVHPNPGNAQTISSPETFTYTLQVTDPT